VGRSGVHASDRISITLYAAEHLGVGAERDCTPAVYVACRVV
jgi:hypothetical protein